MSGLFASYLMLVYPGIPADLPPFGSAEPSIPEFVALTEDERAGMRGLTDDQFERRYSTRYEACRQEFVYDDWDEISCLPLILARMEHYWDRGNHAEVASDIDRIVGLLKFVKPTGTANGDLRAIADEFANWGAFDEALAMHRWRIKFLSREANAAKTLLAAGRAMKEEYFDRAAVAYLAAAFALEGDAVTANARRNRIAGLLIEGKIAAHNLEGLEQIAAAIVPASPEERLAGELAQERVARALGNSDRAVQLARNALATFSEIEAALSPDRRTAALAALGQAYAAAGEIEAARPMLEQALSASPPGRAGSDLELALARIDIRHGRYDGALMRLRRVADGWFGVQGWVALGATAEGAKLFGDVLLALSRPSDAERAYNHAFVERIVFIGGDDPVAAFYLVMNGLASASAQRAGFRRHFFDGMDVSAELHPYIETAGEGLSPGDPRRVELFDAATRSAVIGGDTDLALSMSRRNVRELLDQIERRKSFDARAQDMIEDGGPILRRHVGLIWQQADTARR